MKWAIVIEQSANGYGGYVPDLPGIGVVGDTPEEVRELLTGAIELYLEERAANQGIVPPLATVEYLEVGSLSAQPLT